jgi:hypothetical protein
VPRQHPLDGAAQQRRIVARHRRDDQQLRSALHALAPEALQLAERLAQHDLLGDRDLATFDDGVGQAEVRLAPRRRRMGKNVKGRCDDRPHVGISKRIDRVLHPAGANIGEGAGTGKQRALYLIRVVKHRTSAPCARSYEEAMGI